MRYADQVWPSDNTDAFDRLLIQDGFTYAYAPGVMMAWVTDSPSWVNHGLLYRLISPQNGSEHSVTESVSHDQDSAVIFAFLHSNQILYPFPRIYFRGLKPDTMYRIAALDGKLSANTPEVASGFFWMQHGVDVELRGDFQAAAFTLEMTTHYVSSNVHSHVSR